MFKSSLTNPIALFSSYSVMLAGMMTHVSDWVSAFSAVASGILTLSLAYVRVAEAQYKRAEAHKLELENREKEKQLDHDEEHSH